MFPSIAFLGIYISSERNQQRTALTLASSGSEVNTVIIHTIFRVAKLLLSLTESALFRYRNQF
jgi:hypothetical protein